MTNDLSATSAFNARRLSGRQVAGYFVEPDTFSRLITNDHALLSGPRGSGKTTLLKMLTSEALESWDHPTASDVRAQVTYPGVFIPTDRAWNAQLMPSTDGNASRFTATANGAFTVHVVRSLVDAMAFRLGATDDVPPSSDAAHLRVTLSSQDEAQLTASLAGLLQMDEAASSLEGLRRQLTGRLLQLGQINSALRRGETPAAPAWVDLDALVLAEEMARLFNQVSNEHGRRWALLFDELELAPHDLLQQLLAALRSQHPLLIFKLSISPVHDDLVPGDTSLAADHGQDYEFISLTYPRKRDATAFARSLLVAELNRRGLDAISPSRLLGLSAFDSSDDVDEPDPSDEDVAGSPEEADGRETDARPLPPSWRRRGKRPDVYAPTGLVGKAFLRLANSDETFADYLARRRIDLNNLDALTPTERAARLRKVRNLVVVRDFFRNHQGQGRSRKTYALYTGAQSILSLVDGNPRLLIAMIRQLLPPGSPVPTRPITPAEQSKAIESALDRFHALLATLPGSTLPNGTRVTVPDVLDAIGGSLARRIIDAPFSDNAPCAFHVDEQTPDAVVECLEQAVNAGAIVHVPAKGEAQQLPRGLGGQVFRLTYLLAPYYGLPLRLGKDVAVSRLLPAAWTGQPQRRRRSKPRRTVPQQHPGQGRIL